MTFFVRRIFVFHFFVRTFSSPDFRSNEFWLGRFSFRTQGRRHQILFGGTDSWAPKLTYPQNSIYLRISATLFWKCRKMQNLHTYVSRKKKINIIISGGTSPRWFFNCGGRVPLSPRFRRPCLHFFVPARFRLSFSSMLIFVHFSLIIVSIFLFRVFFIPYIFPLCTNCTWLEKPGGPWGTFPSWPHSISWVGPGGTQGITKMGPFHFSWTVLQQLQLLYR